MGRCAYCGSHKLIRSRSADPWQLLLLRPLIVPIRCGRCGRRFHRTRLMLLAHALFGTGQ